MRKLTGKRRVNIIAVVFSLAIVLFCSAFGIVDNALAAIPAIERQALIALYNSTDGDNWTNNSGWKTPPLDTDGFAFPGTENNWCGVTVSGDRVTELDLAYNQLTGGIPAELGNLTNLQSLDLYGNQLSGTIPTQLGNLTNLQELVLGYNQQIHGTIPPELGNLANLQYLDLGYNQLTGTIPPELGNLANLQSLYLIYNQLSGTIPTQLVNLAGLTELYLGYNQLTGTIPSWLGSMVNLTVLFLGENQLPTLFRLNWLIW